MSENLDSPLPEGIHPITELPTLEGPSLHGRRIVAGRYEILSQLGKGGMGEVWHAYDLKLRVDVALKSLRVDLKKSANLMEALRREVRTAREVISPNVCRIFDLVVEEQQELISMEYIDGITLTAMLVKKGPLELRAARDIAAQFLAGLEAIHQAGLVHRDLKPENIMITRTGRVVVMDFGIAKQVTQLGGTISGTPPYMSPEQLSGEKVDARSDVFSAGVVLAEMIHPEGVYSQQTREVIWNAVRKHPMQLPESPWKAVIARAVAAKPENRFASAGALSRALEEVTLRVETIEERKPYPGLASFTAADAEYFFGRELEVETVIKKLQQLHLMALIGPSGAGKTSMLRAGLIPALPKDWSYVLTQPGDAPFVNLAQALVPEISGDLTAMRNLVRFEDQNTALSVLKSWKQSRTQAFVIIDRFEELFTLNSTEIQNRFAELIGKAVLETDIRVLLAMRDDFLFHCSDHLALSPIFSELTPLVPLSGASLRRALVQPALKAGYKFEDEALVDEILADIEKERGALPLMAFAAARLWEKRDRTSGQLTREAYKEIGGVAGALAQHAESTMERIGTERLPIVREIFRNLITAQNTRAARDTEELLSVFPNRKDAEEALRMLIDARLLTSFESKQEGKEPTSRVEIVHESLLSAWPRLVRWQTQDADSAQLRDQLRQAAQLWEQRSRSEDLLWTGTPYLEFQAWRQRYQGGLSTTEEAFAKAMVSRANKRRRRRRLALALSFATILLVAVALGVFWRQSEISREKAEKETKRAEASSILSLGQMEAESYPSAALAYAIKSLELSDTMEARMFALKLIQQAPLAIVMPANQEDGLEAHRVDFSPDGKWIAVGGYRRTQIRSLDGNGPTILAVEYPSRSAFCEVQFGPNSDRLFTNSFGDIRVFSIPYGKQLGRLQISEGRSWMARGQNGLFIFTQQDTKRMVHFLPYKETELQELGKIPVGPTDLRDTTLLYTNEGRKVVYARSLKDWNTPPEIVLEQRQEIIDLAIHPDANEFAIVDRFGEIGIWPLDRRSAKPLRVLQSPGLDSVLYDPTGVRLVAGGELVDGRITFHVWDRRAPASCAPVVITRTDVPHFNGWTFHPSGKWLATTSGFDVALWPLPAVSSKTLVGHGPATSIDVAFTSDGRHLFSASGDGTVRSWDLSGRMEEPAKIVLEESFLFPHIVLDSRAKRFLVSARGGRILVANLDGTDLRTLEGFSKNAVLFAVALDSGGRLVAAAPFIAPKEEKVLRVWNLESGHVDVLGPLSGGEEGMDGGIFDIKFLDEGHVLLSGTAGLQLFDIRRNSHKILSSRSHADLAISTDRRFLIATQGDDPRDISSFQFLRISLENSVRTVLKSFGDGGPIALDPTGQILVTRSNRDGFIRVGNLSSGQEPHILFGQKGIYNSVVISPDGRWIASTGDNGKILLSPMPDLSKPAPHTLPYDLFVAKLKSFTNLRVVSDPHSSTGWKAETGTFPGWEKVPAW